MKVYTEHEMDDKHETMCICNDVAFQANTSKIMDKLWSYFYSTENYPEYYLGIATRVAICKDPISEKEYWYNADRCLCVDNPKRGSIVTVSMQIKNAIYKKDLIFIGWVRSPVHEWRMKTGSMLLLEQKFIDGLLPQDKRFLRMH